MAGYSSTPLLKKLGIKAGDSICVIDPPVDYFTWISPLPEDIVVNDNCRGRLNFIHIFAHNVKSMRKELGRARKHLNSSGMIWVSWPKKASKAETDLDENKIREAGLGLGLVDVKVCAVTEFWSGLKFVIPLIHR
jgi:hypothetical protein